MNKESIEYLLTLKPPLPKDVYRESIVDILTPPAWYRPLARARFYRTHDTRVGLVMAEYAKDLLEALYGGKTQTVTNDTRPTETEASQSAHPITT